MFQLNRKSTTTAAENSAAEIRESLISAASQLKVKPILSMSDLRNRNFHPDPSLQKAAEDVNGVLLYDGSLLTPQPLDRRITAIKRIAEEAGVAITSFPAMPDIIRILQSEASSDNSHDAPPSNPEGIDEEELESSSAARCLAEYVSDAFLKNASDIHIEIRKNKTFIKYRVLSKLRVIDSVSRGVGLAIANVAFRVFSTENYNIKEIKKGSFDINTESGKHRLRINNQPAAQGADVVMRFLSNDEETALPTLAELGYGRLHQYLLTESIRANNGIILFSGPTGSGKTTSIASVMAMIPSARKKYTIEDPVEKIIPDTTQIQITVDAENDEEFARKFDQTQRSLMRQDPDVVMVGEVRDLSVANVILKLSTTGHLALGTIHTNSALSTLTRLNDLGVSFARMAAPGTLNLLVFQRLIGELCPACKVSYTDVSASHPYVSDPKNQYAKQRVDEALPVLLKEQTSTLYTHNPAGCDVCNGEGYSKCTVISEITQVDNALREFIAAGDLAGAETYLKTIGWESIADHCLHLVRLGLADPYDADELVGPFSATNHFEKFNYNNARKTLSKHLNTTKKALTIVGDIA